MTTVLFAHFKGAPCLAPEVRHKGNCVPENKVLEWPVNFTVVWRFMLGAHFCMQGEKCSYYAKNIRCTVQIF